MRSNLSLSACISLFCAACVVEGSATDPQANVSVASVGSNAGASSGSAAPSSAERTEEITTESGTINVRHSASLAPAIAGCADGTREAFHDTATFPNIAGCMASWSGSLSLRAAATSRACGDATSCGAPADACAPGWHLCGADGSVAEVRQVTAQQCASAGAGRFSAAISHCLTQSHDCASDAQPNANYQCFSEGFCAEPVCCGEHCGEFGLCRDGVWPGQTHIPVGQDQGCGNMSSQRAGGVLCCKSR